MAVAHARTRTPVSVPVQQEAPRRIMRISRSRTEQPPVENNTAVIETILQLIAKNTGQIEVLVAANEQASAALHAALVAAKIVGYTDGAWEAKIVDVMSKTSKDIDPAKVKDSLGLEDFMKVVKVSATELKQFMSEREINAVSKITPAKVTGNKLVVSKVEVKVTTKATTRRK